MAHPAATPAMATERAVPDLGSEPSAAITLEAKPTPSPRAKPRVPRRSGGKRYRIQLSALKSEAAAHREWRRLKRSHRRLLAGQDPIVVRGRPPGRKAPVWRLQLANLKTERAARSFCRRAKSAKLGCIVVVQ